MNAKQHIKHYLDALLHELKQVILVLRLRPHEQISIHQLRLILKRLQSFTFLLNQLGAKKIRLIKRLNTLFLAAGKVRDLDVQGALGAKIYADFWCEHMQSLWRLRRENALNTFLRVLKHLSFRQVKRFLQRLKCRVRALGKKQILAQMINLIRQKLSEISDSSILAEDKALHKLRTKLKRIQYWLEFLVKTLKAGSPYLEVYQTLKNITENLGQWHDHVLLRQQIDKRSADIGKDRRLCVKTAQIQWPAKTSANRLQEQIGLLVVALKA